MIVQNSVTNNHSKFRNKADLPKAPNYQRLTLRTTTILLLVLAALVPSSVAQQSQLQTAQFNVENTFVSVISNVTFELFKKTNSNPLLWQPNMCFELKVLSPYQNPADYSAFNTLNQPFCQPFASDVTVKCNLKPGSNDTLQFLFPTIGSSSAGLTSLRFNITNFYTPFSSQKFPSITLSVFADSACTKVDLYQRAQIISGVTIRPRSINADAVKISTSNKTIAYSGPDNTISVTFTPQSTMAPGGAGSIHILMPYWYQIGSANVMPYNQKAINQCTSTCMNIYGSSLQGQYIEVLYRSMKPTCFLGTTITINCTGFYNPIYQDKWDNYIVEVYDAEATKKLIQSSVPTSLDATQYDPAIIPADSFQVAPFDQTINTESIWTMSFNPGVPLGQECYIVIYFPRDLAYNFEFVQADGIFLPKNLQSLLSTTDLVFLPATKQEPRQAVKFYACNDQTALGLTPFGQAVISQITTQRAIKDSDSFGLAIFKDEDLTQKIAVIQSGVIVTAEQLSPGQLNQVRIWPLIQTVQVSSLIYVTFTITHNLYQGAQVIITMPQGLILPANGTIVQITPLQGSTRATTAIVVEQTIVIQNFVTESVRVAPFAFTFGISQISNQISAKDAGSFTISTWYLASDTKYYLIDIQNVDTSFTATTGLLSADKDITIDNPTNYAYNAVYTFTYSEDSMVPAGGYVQINFPVDLQFNNATILQEETCATTICTLVGQNSIMIQTLNQTAKSQQIKINLGGIHNSRSTQPSGSFVITTYDTDRVSKIDIGFQRNIATTIAGKINQFTLTRQSTVNGVSNSFNFTIDTLIPIYSGDILKFSFPSEIVVNAKGKTTICTPLNPSDRYVCGISGNDITITIISLTNENNFSWEMTNIANPGSVAPSSGFYNIKFFTPQGYLVSEFKNEPTAGVTNTIPANLTTYKIFQDSYQNSAVNNYTITFTPINALPSNGSIKLIYPAQIQLQDGVNTKCFVTTNKLFSQNCNFDITNRTIVITDIFTTAAPYSSEITIMIQNVINPPDNRRFPNDGFDLFTYSDKQMKYISDIAINILTPTLSCDFPCSTCMDGDRLSCTSCWQNNPQITLNYLMTYADPNQKGQCKSACDFNFTSNGNPQKFCTKCDESCNGCIDQGKINDTQHCLTCANTHPFRLNNTDYCLNTCNQGIFPETTLFQQSEFVCDICDQPCLGCWGQKSNCTSCDQTSVNKNLWQNKCIKTCPDGTTSVAGVCIPCASPCKTCTGAPNICLDCDGSNGKSLLLNNTCYSDCPLQYANDVANKVCVGCLTGCDRCNVTNSTQCLTCGDKLFLANDTCLGSCPAEFKGVNRVCVTANGDDLRVLWFPFLIAAFLFTIVVFFGKLKKKAILVDGKMKNISLQWSIVALIAVIAPLQTLAVIVQCILSAVYMQPIHIILAAIVIILALGCNIAFFIWYLRKFFSKKPAHVPSVILFKGKEIKITNVEEANQYPQEVDQLFSLWQSKHRTATWFVLLSALLLNFKITKLFYSRFYMFDMFKAQWTHATYLRLNIFKWSILYICLVDIVLIGISVFGLLFIKWTQFNQLTITMIETIVLSIYLIILVIIERIYLDRIFDYTENQSQLLTSEAMKKYDGKKGRKLQMNNLLSKVKHSSSAAFKDNKLSDLLQMFGGRRCKSMTELATGWPNEDDPRHIKTWPVSISLFEELELAGFKKFTAEDSYALQDNCYAEGVNRHKGKDKNIQGDAAKLEFQSALNRKHGDLMAKLDEEDELHTRKGIRRRGRKNKYYNQIDLEDDQEIDPDEASDKDTDLQIIKEQEEEEENLRKMVQESSKKQQEVTAKRSLKIDAERLTREQREEHAAGELKLKQLQEAQAIKKQQMIEALRLQQEELQRKQLEEESAQILKQREIQDAQEQAALAAASEAARREYEAQEAKRIALEEEEKKRRLAEEEALLAADLARAKLEKENALAQIERERQEADARKLLENQMLQEQQEQLRIQEKEAQRLRDQKLREERLAAEAAEKLAKQISDEKQQQEAAAAKEARKLQEKQLKDQERATKEAEKAMTAAQLKAEKEQRHAKEEEERRLAKEKEAIDKAERDRLRALAEAEELEQQKQKSQLPVAATSVVKQESSKVKQESVTETNEENKMHSKVSVQEEQYKLKSIIDSEDLDVLSGIVDVNTNVMQEFQHKQEHLITIPPNSQLRTFNEHDVLGDFDRDEKGNVVVLEDQNGRKHDKKRNQVNQRGYLVDSKTNDVIENLTGQPMFSMRDLDERGEVPAPFCIEKYNFNPHNLMGDFDYQDGKPILMKTAQGFYIDKKARRVSNNGWFTIPNQGHIVDKDGRKKFDKKQLQNEDLHKLFNYNGKRFDIKDVIGQFNKDQNGNIQTIINGNQLFDNLGRLVNEKGYLIDASGNIIDTQGRQLWKKTDLKSGEFPKIFPFTKFNIQRIQGEIDLNANGTPNLKKGPNGQGYVDRKGRAVNVRGYLVDRYGNVVDIHGKVMFEKIVLEQDGEIPQVFRTGLLRSDTASSLSRLMSEIERNQSEYGGRGAGNDAGNDSAYERLKNNDGDTSVDSKMEDTPANYNMANQRFDSDGNNQPIPEDEEGGEHMAPSDFSDQEDPAVLIQKKKQKPKKKKKKAKLQTIEFLEPTNREKNMAGAYGGMARGEIRRPGIKYDKERLNNSKKFRVSTADEPRIRAQLTALANNTTGSAFPEVVELGLKKPINSSSKEQNQRPEPKRQGLMKASDGLSSHSKSIRDTQVGKNKKPLRNNNTQSQKKGINDADFEQMFGKDIDQFLENSEWDIESQDKVSQGSRGSRNSAFNAQKLKAMEKVYLKRMETRPDQQSSQYMRGADSRLEGKKKKDVKGPDRETIIAITDDPGVIHRGEILPFATKKNKSKF